MAIPLSINGQVFEYPENFDEGWGINATGWAQAVTNGMLQRAGGNFPLLSDVNFGASFGLVSIYYKSRSANIATTGTVRLASADPGVVFRNNANTGNLILTTDASNNLLFNGIPIGSSNTLTDNHIFVGNASNVPTDVALSGDATIVASGALTIANGAITNGKVASAAAIAVNKLAALTNNKAVATDSSGFLVSSTTTDTELGFVGGVTSAIQTQINSITASSIFVSGDMKAAGYTAVPTGWLLCDGTSYLRATYPALFAAIGTTFGSVDGTHFNVPQMVNAVPIGAGSIAAQGVTAGTQTHVISSGELPTHNHTVNVTDPGHRHDFKSYGVSGGTTTEICITTNANTGGALNSYTSATTGPQSNTTGITATTDNAGSSTAMSLVQPSLGVTWFIKI